jgi:hypothetical protein
LRERGREFRERASQSAAFGDAHHMGARLAREDETAAVRKGERLCVDGAQRRYGDASAVFLDARVGRRAAAPHARFETVVILRHLGADGGAQRAAARPEHGAGKLRAHAFGERLGTLRERAGEAGAKRIAPLRELLRRGRAVDLCLDHAALSFQDVFNLHERYKPAFTLCYQSGRMA